MTIWERQDFCHDLLDMSAAWPAVAKVVKVDQQARRSDTRTSAVPTGWADLLLQGQYSHSGSLAPELGAGCVASP